MKKLLQAAVPFTAIALQAANYGPANVVDTYSAMTNRGGSVLDPALVVLGGATAGDGNGGLFIYSASDTNTIDSTNYFAAPRNTAGRWVRVNYFLKAPTPVSYPLLLTSGSLSLASLTNWFALSVTAPLQISQTATSAVIALPALTNWFTFAAGANMQVTVTSNSVTYAMTNSTGSTLFVDTVPVVNPNLADTSIFDWTVAASTNATLDIKSLSIPLDRLYPQADGTLIGGWGNGGGGGQLKVVTLGANLTLNNSTGELSASGGGGTNNWQIGVDGVIVSSPNLADSSELGVSASGTNITYAIVAASIAQGKLATTGTGTSTNFLAGDYSYKQVTTNMIPGLNAILATIGSGSSYSFTNGVTNAAGVVNLAIDAGANITLSTNGQGRVTITATTSGGTGAAVTVDGGADLTRANFSDSTGINFAASGTNVTANLIDRDFGSITVSSSGTVMTIDNDAVALGTQTTGNYVATVAGTANEVSVSGSGSETAAVTVSLPTTIDLGSKTSFELPNAAAPTTDAFGEVAGDDNAWATGRGALQVFDGTANTYLLGALSSDTPSNGQVPTWNTGGTITWETPSGGGGGSSTNIQVNGVLVTQANLTNSTSVRFEASGTNIYAHLTNSFPDGYYAGGYLPLFAGASNALTGDLHFKQSSDIRVPMWESGTDKNAVGFRANNGVYSITEYNTNDFTVLETFVTVDPTDTTTDIITFANSGFNNLVVFDAPVVFNEAVTNNGTFYHTTFSSTNIFLPDTTVVVGFDKEFVAGQAVSVSALGNPELGGVVASSATSAIGTAITNHLGILRLTSSTTASSYYGYVTPNTSFFAEPGLTFLSVTRALGTNAGVRVQYGFTDALSISTPTDAIRVLRTNNFLIPQVYNNSTLTQGSEYAISSNQWLRVKITVLDDDDTRFEVHDADNGTEIMSTTLNASLPNTSSRVFGAGIVAGYTNSGSTLPLEDLDRAAMYISTPIAR